jgi:hypothetical protein
MTQRKPVMIGAHVPKPRPRYRPRCKLHESAQMVCAAFDTFTRSRGSSHLARAERDDR